MFPAILNSLARGITGHSSIIQGGSISNLLDEDALNKIVESAWDKTWGYLIRFGNLSAGLIGIMMVFKGIKLIIDTVIHGYALHTVYGWSIHLVGAIWDSVTSLLLHIGRRRPKPNNRKKEDKEETMEPLQPPSYQVFAGPAEELPPFLPINYEFDPRLKNIAEPTLVSEFAHRTLPRTGKREEIVPMHSFSQPQTSNEGETAPMQTQRVYDSLPRTRPVSMMPTIPCSSTNVTEKESEPINTQPIYPNLHTNTEVSNEEFSNKNKQYFLIRKLKFDEK